MRLRPAYAEEGAWINERYAAVQFMPSDLSRDLVLIAEIDGERAGIARLVPADEVWELGGMLVFEQFRGRGVARALIDELLRYAGDRDVYCIPFADLEPLYAAAGFTRAEDAPRAVREKFEWCQRTYAKDVLLMERRRPGG